MMSIVDPEYRRQSERAECAFVIRAIRSSVGRGDGMNEELKFFRFTLDLHWRRNFEIDTRFYHMGLLN